MDFAASKSLRIILAPQTLLRGTLASLALLAASTSGVAPALAKSPLVSYEEAARHGLERVWFAQTPLDPSRSRATMWFQYFDCLYCITDSGTVTALNAETGAQLWSRQIGNAGLEAFGPDANRKYLGVVSGARMYMLDRATGVLAWSRELGSAPSSGPALTADYAYIALVTGRIEAYKLDDPTTQPWYYHSRGRTYLRPTATGRVVSWPTTEGYLYVSRANDPGVLFRLRTSNDIVTSPAQMDPYLYIASLDGYLYCMHELTGREQWRYTTGYGITSSPAIVENRAYVASIEPMLHCVDATTGAPLWTAAGISHFAAKGKDRVYASDQFGNLLVLDAATGNPVSRMKTADGTETLVNDQTDRIFLINDRGLVQCLREIGANKPTMYRQPIELLDPAERPTGAAGVQPTGEMPPAETGEPAAEGETPFEPEAAEDEPAADEPAGDEPEADEPDADEPAAGLEDDNPFGDF